MATPTPTPRAPAPTQAAPAGGATGTGPVDTSGGDPGGTINSILGPQETSVPEGQQQPAGATPQFQLDPQLAALLQQAQSSGSHKVDPTVAAGERIYFQIWGVKPPHGYIRHLVQQGMNVFEIAQHELSKPGARKTQYYRDRFAEAAYAIAQAMGFR